MRDDVFTEVREYVLVLWRRWPFVVVPTLVVALLSVVTFSLPEPTYSTSVQHIVSQEPTVSADGNEEQRQFVWITSQYVVNSLTDWANGTAFAGLVADELIAQGFEINAETVAVALEAGTIRSKLEVYIDHPDEATTAAMAEAATLVLNRDNLTAIPQLGEDRAYLTPIDKVAVEEVAPSLTTYLDLPIRLVVGAGAGLALALFAEYIDPKIRSRSQLRAIDLQLLGEIPAE